MRGVLKTTINDLWPLLVEVLQFSLGIRIHYNSRIIDTYFDDIYFRVMKNETKDYKKQLFKMVNAKICNEQMKKLKNQRKKDLKKPSIEAQAPSKNKSKKKKK